MIRHEDSTRRTRTQRSSHSKEAISMFLLILQSASDRQHTCSNRPRLRHRLEDQAMKRSKPTPSRRTHNIAEYQLCSQARCRTRKICKFKRRKDTSNSNSNSSSNSSSNHNTHRTAPTSCITWLSRERSSSSQANQTTSGFRSIGSGQALRLRHLRPNSELHRTRNTTLQQVKRVRRMRRYPSFQPNLYLPSTSKTLIRNLAPLRRKHTQVP